MSDPQPEELDQAIKLMRETKFKAAFKIIENFEKKEALTPQEHVSALLIKGWIYLYNGKTKEVIDIGDRALKLARKHEMLLESIHARLLKANMIYSAEHFRGGLKAFRLLSRCEKLINSFDDKSSLTILDIKATIFSMKAWFYMFTAQLDLGLESAEKSLFFRKKTGIKLNIAGNYGTLGNAYWRLGELDKALECAMQSLEIIEELNFPRGISMSSFLIGNIYSDKGEYNRALYFLNRSLSFKEIDKVLKYTNLESLAEVYYRKNDLNKALEYLNQARLIVQESNYDILLVRCLNQLGQIYQLKGEYDQAIEVLESSLLISGRVKFSVNLPLLILIYVYLDKGFREKAREYLKRLETLSKFPNIFGNQTFKLANAMFLKTSGRTRNRAEAELLLKEIIESADKPQFQFQSGTTSDTKMLCLVNLCDLYLEDLTFSNDLEVLEDINPLITQMIKFADEKHSVIYLAETKLLQSKLALIQLKTTEAEKLLVEAEKIAETYEFELLAVKISTEHDKLLTQLDVWDDLKEKDAPVSERLKLASFDGVIDGLQRKRAIEQPELVDEEPTLLLILAEGGILLFSYPFTDEWKFDDELFGSFLSAFNSISDEIFAEGLDRVKFGQHTVLMRTVGPFSVCYLYKGQTYSAKIKLTEFTEKLHDTTAIWQLLEKFYKTNQVIATKDSPPLETLITEVFMRNR